jgi:hypothetical protein
VTMQITYRWLVIGLFFLALVLITGLADSWQLAVALLVAAVLVLLGFLAASGELVSDRAALDAERDALDAEWRALDQTRRIRSVFLHARRAMQSEATATWPTSCEDRVDQP